MYWTGRRHKENESVIINDQNLCEYMYSNLPTSLLISLKHLKEMKADPWSVKTAYSLAKRIKFYHSTVKNKLMEFAILILRMLIYSKGANFINHHLNEV